MQGRDLRSGPQCVGAACARFPLQFLLGLLPPGTHPDQFRSDIIPLLFEILLSRPPLRAELGDLVRLKFLADGFYIGPQHGVFGPKTVELVLGLGCRNNGPNDGVVFFSKQAPEIGNFLICRERFDGRSGYEDFAHTPYIGGTFPGL